jgi:tetratricopeptide (TPR) repeat protein
MSGNKAIAALLLLVLPGGFTGLWKLQHRIDKERAGMQQEEDVVLLRSGKLVKLMSLDYAPLVAAIYWTRAVQYYGNKKLNQDVNLKSLWPLLDVATTLDPNMIPAYRFGSTFLAEPAPRGAGQPLLAVKLLERGIAANPDQWRLYMDLGYVYYFELRDYKKSSEAFLKGSENPNAMFWMKVMAARIAEAGNSWDTSAFLWKQVYETSTDEQVKENARVHILLLRVDKDLDELSKLIAVYEKKEGRPPANLREVALAGLLRGEPVDPLGYRYVLKNGKPDLNPASPLYKQRSAYDTPLP